MGKLKVIWGFLKLLMPEWATALVYSGRRTEVAGRRIDAKAQAAGDLVSLLRDPNLMPSVEESRQQLETMAAKFDRACPKTVTTMDLELPGVEGTRPARVYLPDGHNLEHASPTLVYLHGGGWVQGSIGSHDGLCGNLAHRAGIRVLSYDYRLAPEHPFPAAPDDVLAFYRALIAGRTPIAADPATLAVGGDSAGGNLAACLMHDICKADLPLPKAQLLIYPGLDARLCSKSMQDLKNQPLLPATRIKWYLDLYLPRGQDRLDPRVSPLFSDTLVRQPEAMIVAGGHDPLWDDALAYADKLKEAGVPVELLPYPGQIHAFVSFSKIIPQGRDAIDQMAVWLQRMLKG